MTTRVGVLFSILSFSNYCYDLQWDISKTMAMDRTTVLRLWSHMYVKPNHNIIPLILIVPPADPKGCLQIKQTKLQHSKPFKLWVRYSPMKWMGSLDDWKRVGEIFMSFSGLLCQRRNICCRCKWLRNRIPSRLQYARMYAGIYLYVCYNYVCWSK